MSRNKIVKSYSSDNCMHNRWKAPCFENIKVNRVELLCSFSFGDYGFQPMEIEFIFSMYITECISIIKKK